MRNRKNEKKKERKNTDHNKRLSVQVSSSSINMNGASKKRKNVTPNVIGSMTDADETGLTQSPKGHKSSRLISYDENENEEKDEDEGAERGQSGGIRGCRRVGDDDDEKDNDKDKDKIDFINSIRLNFNLNRKKCEERISGDIDDEDDHDATHCVNKKENSKDKGRGKGEGKGKERRRSARVNDFNDRSRNDCEEDGGGDPDLDIEGMWREVAGEGERDRDGGGGGDEDENGIRVKERNGDYRGGEGEGEEKARDGRMFGINNNDIATIQQMEGILKHNAHGNHALRNEKGRENDRRNDYAEFSTDEDSDNSNETSSNSSTSSSSPSRFSASSSSTSSSSPGSMSSYQCNNGDKSNSSSRSSSSNEELDALVIKEQEISKMIQLSQSVGHAFMPFKSFHATVHSFIHSSLCLLLSLSICLFKFCFSLHVFLTHSY